MFGKKDDSGHYLVEATGAVTDGKLTALLNARWGDGWRFVRMNEAKFGWLIVFERADD